MRELVRELAAAVASDAEFMSAIWVRARLAPPSPCAGARHLVEEAQSRGELRQDVPAAELAELLRAAVTSTLVDWLLGSSSSTPASLATRLQRVVDLVLDGSRKRNERVRAPTVSQGTKQVRSGSAISGAHT